MSILRPIDPRRIELLDDAMVEVLRKKSPVERLEMVFAAERTMRLMVTAHLQSEHPEWTPEQISKEIARRRLCSKGDSIDELLNPESVVPDF
jgi:hypothetical protein